MKFFNPTVLIGTLTSIRTSSLYVLTCLLINCALFFPLQQTAKAQTVNIPAPNLRTAIETALGKAAGTPISTDEMAQLTSLESRYKSILIFSLSRSTAVLRHPSSQLRASRGLRRPCREPSPAVGQRLTIRMHISNGRNVAGYWGLQGTFNGSSRDF